MSNLVEDLKSDARDIAGDLAALRHALHLEPELGLELPRTQEKVLGALDGCGLELTLGTGRRVSQFHFARAPIGVVETTGTIGNVACGTHGYGLSASCKRAGKDDLVGLFAHAWRSGGTHGGGWQESDCHRQQKRF